jgi:hypothetical protein
MEKQQDESEFEFIFTPFSFFSLIFGVKKIILANKIQPKLARIKNIRSSVSIVGILNCIEFSLFAFLVLVQVLKELLCAEHLCDAHELVVVVVAVEEGLLPEDHGRQHAAQRPHVQRVAIHLR